MSVSFAVSAIELRVALLVAPVVETVTAFVQRSALTQVLARVSEADTRVLVSVQTIAPGVRADVSTLPTSVLPRQAGAGQAEV